MPGKFQCIMKPLQSFAAFLPAKAKKKAGREIQDSELKNILFWFSHVYFVKINTGEKEREERYV